MTSQTFVFECSSSTYLDCVEKNLFSSNKPWLLEIKTSKYVLLHLTKLTQLGSVERLEERKATKYRAIHSS